MNRTNLALLALLVAAAGPRDPLPMPPIPPPQPPADQSAPVPNPDARAPAEVASGNAHVGLQDFRVNRFNQGLGYVPGSQFETSEEKRPIQTPGLTLQVPIR
jgi:hypothetical protein